MRALSLPSPPALSPVRPPARPPAVPIAAPWLPPWEEVAGRFEEIWRGGRLTNGACVERLEAETAAWLGVRECVAVSSCTCGLMLAARCLGLRGEVIVPSFTFFATGHALLWNGLTPVFADCHPETFNLDPRSAAGAVGAKTSAMIGVHNFGCPCAVEELGRLARRRGLRLLFDGAHALGALVNGRSVAAWGDATVFSLAATKPLAAGEGGLIATRDAALARRLRQARNYGNDGSYDCPVLGLNARMTEMQAALALAGLPYVEAGIERRQLLAGVYQERLTGAAAGGARLGTQRPAPEARGTWNGFPIVARPQAGVSREAIEASLAAAGVETRRYYDPPLHRQRLYRRFYQPGRQPLAVTDSISSRVVSLPLYAALAVDDAERISGIVTTCVLAGGKAAAQQPPEAPRGIPESVCAS